MMKLFKSIDFNMVRLAHTKISICTGIILALDVVVSGICLCVEHNKIKKQIDENLDASRKVLELSKKCRKDAEDLLDEK